MMALLNTLTGPLTLLLTGIGLKGPAAKALAALLISALGSGLAYALAVGFGNVEISELIAVMLGAGSGGGAGAYSAVDTRVPTESTESTETAA